MKRIFLAFTMLALIWPAIPRAQGTEVSFDFFYNNISGGSWIEVADYGYCWQPDVVVTNRSWRPYADGYWAYTDCGWTWVSYEDFGWATYHYGRWVRLADYGWVWAPGRDSELEWGPAWVSWRTGGDYIGWAPLPPEVTFVDHRFIGGRIDADFDIGPGYYNFVEVRYIGEPVLRERIVDVSQNVTYIQQTVNVTNITYNKNIVVNNGPDIDVINTRASRPIQRLKLEVQENADVSAAARSKALIKVQGDKLVVAAPLKVTKPPQLPPPPAVKTKVTQAKVDKGWSVVPDPKLQTELRQKIKTEDASKVQTATGATATGQAASNASPSGAPITSPAELEKGKHQGKHGEELQTNVAESPGASPGAAKSPATSPAELGKGRHGGQRGEQLQPNATAAPTGSPAGEASPAGSPMERAKHKGRPGEMQNAPLESTGAPTAAPEGASQTGGGKHKGRGQSEQGSLGQSPGQPADLSGEQGQGRHQGHRLPETGASPSGGGQSPESLGGSKQRRLEQSGTPPPTGGQEPQSLGGGGGKHKGQGQTAEPSNVQPSPASGGGEQRQGRGEGKTKKAGETSPAPSPQ